MWIRSGIDFISHTNYSIIDSEFIFFLKAERRLHESRQKLDLLQCSLEKIMGELSPKQAAVGIYKDEYISTSASYTERKSVGLGKEQYTAITKPAALTGQLEVRKLLMMDDACHHLATTHGISARLC